MKEKQQKGCATKTKRNNNHNPPPERNSSQNTKHYNYDPPFSTKIKRIRKNYKKAATGHENMKVGLSVGMQRHVSKTQGAPTININYNIAPLAQPRLNTNLDATTE